MIEPLFDKIFSKKQRSTRYTLDTMREAYAKLNLAERVAPSILVAGTNGKGSTSGYLAKLYAAEGLKVGINTSPHLCDFRERIQCSHFEVTDSFLVDELLSLQADLGQDLFDRLSFFEVTTLLAFRVFIVQETDINIIEVGLGGRLDATNVIDPIASLVVSIGFDHCRILGETKVEIFNEKLGIARSHRPLFLGFDLEKDADASMREAFSRANKLTAFMPIIRGKHFALVEDKVFIAHGPKELSFSLPKSVQKASPILQKNFSLALMVYFSLKDPKKLPEKSAYKTLMNFDQQNFQPFSLLCRFQSFHLKRSDGTRQQLFLDVCHNEESLKEMLNSLKQKRILRDGEKLPVFCSILSDKPMTKMLDSLSDLAKPLILFACSSSRSFSVGNLDQRFQYLSFFGSFQEALEQQEVPYSDEVPWLVCGSFYAVGEVLSFLKSQE